MKKNFWVVLLTTWMAALSAQAEATFGAEFTFTNREMSNSTADENIVNSEESEEYRDRMAEAVRELCDGCRVIRQQNSYGVDTYKVQYRDGFYFIIATDPGVVEVQTKPMTNSEIAANLQRMDRDLFGAARAVGMRPVIGDNGGGGHIHIGFLSSVQGELLLMRNIIVDFANHSEIASGVLANDEMNAPPVSDLPKNRQAALKRIIADVDAGRIRSTRVLARRIQQEVYNYHSEGWEPPEKYQALNLSRLSGGWDDAEKTFEIRSLEAQRNATEYLALTRLFEGRIEYLRHLNRPIPLEIPGKMSTTQKFKRFARYVAEAGLDFAEFRKMFRFEEQDLARQITEPAPFILCRRAMLF
jgi:hypothetical protein